MTRRIQTLTREVVLLGIVFLSVSPLVFSHNDDLSESVMHKVIKSVPVTGANSFCGESIFKFPEPFPQDLQLVFIGEYDESANALDAIPLSEENCRSDTILATTTDPGLVALLGGEDADSRLKNRKLRDVPTYLGTDGVRRLIPRTSSVDGMFPPVKVDGADDITLGDWVKGEGQMQVTCRANGESTVRIDFEHILPNSLYTLWGMYATVPPGEFQRQLIPVPLGGVPNVMTSDKQGRGSFERTINGCPLEVFSDGSELMMIILNYHADGSVYGADPDIGTAKNAFILEDGSEFMSTHPAGILNHDQLIFPVRLLEYQ